MTEQEINELADEFWMAELGYESIKDKIREAVEKGSIGFAEFIKKELWLSHSALDNQWTNYYRDDYPTTEQLYQEYLKSLNK